jgi:tetratricopeptide (TPR) repeat protein
MHEGFVRFFSLSNSNKFTPVGAGILVSRQWIITCAHVVNSSLNLPPGSTEIPTGDVWLDFPFVAPKKVLKSYIVAWQPPQEEMRGDIAGLCLLNDIPPGATPLELIETNNLWDVPFRAFGFPASYDDGIYARGALIDYTTTGWLQVEGDFESSTRIQPGFSGGPIWVESMGGVVGMIVMAEKLAQSKLAFAIPTSVLIDAWADLSPLAHHRELDDSSRKDFLIQSAEFRQDAHQKRNLEWQIKGYQNSSMPSLEAKLKDQIFSSRSRELGMGIKTLKDHRTLLITGLPGIGKSILARALLELMPINSPPAFWYDFKYHQSSGNTLGAVLDNISSYFEPLLGAEARETLLSYRRSPLDKASETEVLILTDFLKEINVSVWLVFDNLEVVLSEGEDRFFDDGLELLFAGLKKNTHGAKIIITSSVEPHLDKGETLLGFGNKPLALGGLDDLTAISFLQASGLQYASEEDLLSLARRVEGHPFALLHAAHYAEDLGIKATLRNLKGSLTDMIAEFEGFFQQRLSSDDFAACQALTILQRPISLEGLCKIAQCSDETVRHLRSDGLLEKNEKDEFSIPAIICNILTAADSRRVQQAHIRAMQYYREIQIPSRPQSIDQYSNVFEWHYHAIQAEDTLSAYAALFDTGLAERLKQWNEFSLLARMSEDILTKPDTNLMELSKGKQAKIYHTSGIVYYLLGDNEKSITLLKNALDLVPIDENNELRTRVLIDLAESYAGMKEIDLALDYCQQAMTLLIGKHEDKLYAKALQLRGIIYRLQGNMTSALDDLEKARDLFEKLDDQTGTAYVTGELGIVYFYQNRFNQALENYRRTIASCEQNHDLRGTMIGYLNVGDILLQETEYEAASEQFNFALELARKIKFPQYESSAGLNWVEAKIGLHHLDEAENILRSLKSVVEKLADPCLSGQALRLQASLYAARGQADQAEESFKLAFEYLQNEDCQYERARSNLAYADFLGRQGKNSRAHSVLMAAREGFNAINNQLGLNLVDQTLQKLGSS